MKQAHNKWPVVLWKIKYFNLTVTLAHWITHTTPVHQYTHTYAHKYAHKKIIYTHVQLNSWCLTLCIHVHIDILIRVCLCVRLDVWAHESLLTCMYSKIWTITSWLSCKWKSVKGNHNRINFPTIKIKPKNPITTKRFRNTMVHRQHINTLPLRVF